MILKSNINNFHLSFQKSNRSPLFYSVTNNDFDTLQALVNEGADLNIIDKVRKIKVLNNIKISIKKKVLTLF